MQLGNDSILIWGNLNSDSLPPTENEVFILFRMIIKALFWGRGESPSFSYASTPSQWSNFLIKYLLLMNGQGTFSKVYELKKILTIVSLYV